ncbi:transporter, anaerobic C4-dicarboxylate uptake C family [Parasutterella excrementihominis YIT 11859]|uniref:Transporter, anaerobic C4-dicarboxylate uptake C family n=1 Tax=Parasutterella excrementihominis YIT 11859 TaxID=762966 RepID=F3QMF8_9BURK|nr:C4-dicarboxylate transporter DcuC [Parasutterella excrementihominis]EGG52096.1 transporter, anaerobic C4-dicarboxylate uptake C family [Parasutterella excrementihominis YIT 11859]
MFGLIVVLLGIVLVGYLIVKKYYAPWSLLLVGLILLLIVGLFTDTAIVTGKKATNSWLLDIVQVVTNISSSTLAGLGLQIMVISGFADYLDRIGATKSFVKICAKPLEYIHSPYTLLAISYLVGQFINIFIPSAVGLGVLLMLTVYPLLMAVGVSSVSACAVIVTASCLDLGPASANSIVTAKLLGTSAMEYFLEGQLLIGSISALAIAVSHGLIQKYFDKKDLASGRLTADDFKLKSELIAASAKDKQPDAPRFYAILPVLPIVFLFIFSKFCYTGVKLQLATAMFLCMILSFLVDLLTRRKLKECIANTKAFFQGMGRVLTSTVSLIICAMVFAEGLKLSGGIASIISWAASMQNTGGVVMLVVMCALLAIASILTGSANAAFFAFNSLLPHAAKAVNWDLIIMACPVQLVSGIARSMSPIAGVTIAVSSIAGLSPFEVVRRTIPVMIIGMLTAILSSLILLG